jgi:hypothetical protein
MVKSGDFACQALTDDYLTICLAQWMNQQDSTLNFKSLLPFYHHHPRSSCSASLSIAMILDPKLELEQCVAYTRKHPAVALVPFL